MNTPTIRKTITPKIKITVEIPKDNAYLIFTVAPTSTNSMTSAPTHNSLNFTDILFATHSLFFCSAMPIAITAINDANGISFPHLSSIVSSADAPAISEQAGKKHIKIAGLPTFLKSFKSRDNPALVKIIISVILRSILYSLFPLNLKINTTHNEKRQSAQDKLTFILLFIFYFKLVVFDICRKHCFFSGIFPCDFQQILF